MNIFEWADLVDFTALRPPVWEATHRLASGMPLPAELVPVAEQITGHAGPWRPEGYKRVHVVAGRGSGKTDNGAAIIVHSSVLKDWSGTLRKGRTVWTGFAAQNREIGALAFEAALALLKQTEDALHRKLIEQQNFTKDTGVITLRGTGTGIRVIARDPDSGRGPQWGDFVVEEAGAGAVGDDAARSVGRFVQSISPRVAGTTWLIGTPSGQLAGPLYRSFQRDRHPAARHLYVTFPTWEGSPEFDVRNPGVRDELRETEPALHDVEFGAAWIPLEGGWLRHDTIEHARRSRPAHRAFELGRTYFAACDLGFTHDSSVLEIGSTDGKTARVDFVREIRPLRGTPLVPTAVIAEFADDLRRYRVTKVYGDAYYERTAVYEFGQHDIIYKVQSFAPAEKLKFMAALRTLLLQEQLELPPDERLSSQLRELRMTFTQSGTARFQVPVSRGNDDLAICCGILAGLLLHRLQRGNQSARVIIINRPSTRSDPMFSAGSSTASPWRSIGPGRYTRDWSW